MSVFDDYAAYTDKDYIAEVSNTETLREDRGISSVPRIRIALIFDQVPQSGGAFHQSIVAVEQFKRVCGDIFEIQLFHQSNSGAHWLNEIGLASTPLRETWVSKIVEAMIVNGDVRCVGIKLRSLDDADEAPVWP